jgi:hypothetical protein
MWPLFLLRDKGKQKKMTGTQHVGTSNQKFLHYIPIKMVLALFQYKNNVKLNQSYLHLCYLVATSTGSKSQFFQRWREWEYVNPVSCRHFLFETTNRGKRHRRRFLLLPRAGVSKTHIWFTFLCGFLVK